MSLAFHRRSFADTRSQIFHEWALAKLEAVLERMERAEFFSPLNLTCFVAAACLTTAGVLSVADYHAHQEKVNAAAYVAMVGAPCDVSPKHPYVTRFTSYDPRSFLYDHVQQHSLTIIGSEPLKGLRIDGPNIRTTFATAQIDGGRLVDADTICRMRIPAAPATVRASANMNAPVPD